MIVCLCAVSGRISQALQLGAHDGEVASEAEELGDLSLCRTPNRHANKQVRNLQGDGVSMFRTVKETSSQREIDSVGAKPSAFVDGTRSQFLAIMHPVENPEATEC